ncbi:MAG: S8 family serine peptidase, partial [Anaerolineae bacterium]
ISWGARIMPLKALGRDGVGTIGSLVGAIGYAADSGVLVTCVGAAASAYSQTLRDVVYYAYYRGSLLIAPTYYPYPAAFPYVLGVAATDHNDAHPAWASSSPYVDVSAPGEDIVSTFWRGSGESYGVSSSTRAAVAHVAGVAALVFSVHPDYFPDEVAQIIIESADDLGPPGRDEYYGYGRINAYRALSGAPPEFTPTPLPTSTPLPTATHTPLPTSTFTPLPTATPTPLPTFTPLPTPTWTPKPLPTETPTPTATPCSGTILLGCVGNNGTIRGIVWYDANGNGRQDLGWAEWPLAGAVLTLRDADGHLIGTYTTDLSGFYIFIGLDASISYTLTETNPPDYPVSTTPDEWLIQPEDFVFCCTVTVNFGDRGGPTPMGTPEATATPTPTGTVWVATPTSTSTPTATPIATPTPSRTPSYPTPPGPGLRIQLPALDNEGGAATRIQVQNVGNTPTKAIMFLWGEYSGDCPPQGPGPIKVECTGLIWPGSAWRWSSGWLPPGAKSAIVYSVPVEAAEDACEEAADAMNSPSSWREWERDWREGVYGTGQPLAVSVNRRIVDASGKTIASAYTGISEDMEGVYDPQFGGFMYYAPLNYNDYQGWTTELIIQNSGDECTSVEVWYREQDDCLRATIDGVMALTPGESVRLTPPLLPQGTRGSAWIRASQPLGVVVDQFGHDMFLTYRGLPADSFGAGFSAGSVINYAPLIYREYNGWDSAIQVQNLSSTFNAKVKVYFLDNSGDIITTLLDWICPRGSQTYFMRAINNLPGQYVGAARIESQAWWSPGDPAVDAPNVVSVVNLINLDTGQGLSYNTFPQQKAEGVKAVAIPVLAKEKREFAGSSVTTWTSEIAIQNINPNPGMTTFRVDLYDQNGMIESFCETVNEKQVDYIRGDNLGILVTGFSGSAVVEVTDSTQPGGGSIAAVVVERAEGDGDLTKGFEAFPINAQIYEPPGVPPCPGLPLAPTPSSRSRAPDPWSGQ